MIRLKLVRVFQAGAFGPIRDLQVEGRRGRRQVRHDREEGQEAGCRPTVRLAAEPEQSSTEEQLPADEPPAADEPRRADDETADADMPAADVSVGEMSAEELADADGAPPEPVVERQGRDVSDELKAMIEALIFASPDPLTPKTLFKLLETEPREDVQVVARRAAP